MENKELMTTYAKAVNYGFQEYGFSVKLPEELTFKEFKTGWDQDDYIHDSSLFRSLADGACYEYGYKIGNYMVMQDYPCYSPAPLQTALRFFFTKEKHAQIFARWVRNHMEDIALENANPSAHVNAYWNHQDAVAEYLDIQHEASL